MFELDFTPDSDETIEERIRKDEEEKLLAPGEGLFQVIICKGMVSQAGNSMFKVSLKGWDINGKEGFVDDFLMVGDKPFFIKRLKGFCDSTGITNIYNTGKIKETDINNSLTGKCVFGTKTYKGKLQNSVEEYIKKSEDQKPIPDNNLNDDLPW